MEKDGVQQQYRFLMALMVSGQCEGFNSHLPKSVPGSKREPNTAASCIPLQAHRATRELWHKKHE